MNFIDKFFFMLCDQKNLEGLSVGVALIGRQVLIWNWMLIPAHNCHHCYLFCYCVYRYFSLREKDNQIESEQKGVFRTNCIDSLDR